MVYQLENRQTQAKKTAKHYRNATLKIHFKYRGPPGECWEIEIGDRLPGDLALSSQRHVIWRAWYQMSPKVQVTALLSPPGKARPASREELAQGAEAWFTFFPPQRQLLAPIYRHRAGLRLRFSNFSLLSVGFIISIHFRLSVHTLEIFF